jgi:hypothetical protein
MDEASLDADFVAQPAARSPFLAVIGSASCDERVAALAEAVGREIGRRGPSWCVAGAAASWRLPAVARGRGVA